MIDHCAAVGEVVVFGEMVRAHRRRLGITQQELAEAAGLSVRGIGRIEAGRTDAPRPTTVRLLADAFGLTGAERDRFSRAAADERVGEASGGASQVPAQLPADIAGFTGRAEQLDRLDALVPSGADGASAVVISAIGGSAGIGKTALAVHWGHRVSDRFPDGQLYVNLRGFDPVEPPMTPSAAVRYFLDSLGVPPQRIPTDIEAQYGLYRSIMAGRRMLVMLDNAREAEQVRPLIPGSPGCMVVVTSRNSLSGLVAAEAAHSMVLDLLTPDEAHELLTARLGKERVTAQPQAVNGIITRCAGLPLGLVIVAAQAAAHPGFPLAAMVRQLDSGGRRLDAFAGDDLTTDLRAVFSWSYHTLTPDTARLFRLLGLHPGPDIAVGAAASLAALPVAAVRPLLAELARAHLLVEHSPGRFAFHDLLRAYAAELARGAETEDERRAALHRMFDHYLHAAHAAKRLLNPNRDPITPAPARPGVSREDITGHEGALAWFTAERPVLLGAVRHAATTGFDIHAWQLAWNLVDYLRRAGYWRDWAATQRTALDAAQRLADPTGRAYAHSALGSAYPWLGHYDDAHTHLRHALDLFDELGDRTSQARTHQHLAWLLDQQGRQEEAIHHGHKAAALYQTDDDRTGLAGALNSVGWSHAQRGDHDQALTYCRQALALNREAGNTAGQAATWDSIGYAHHHLGHHHEAITCYQHALDLHRETGNRYGEAETSTHLGDAHHAVGDPDGARDAWQRALTILDELDHPDDEGVRAKLKDLRRLGTAAPNPDQLIGD
jgi:tetratricopeptide (TPR) repeat protein/transcriptional regulator with XRE-family HTH domain